MHSLVINKCVVASLLLLSVAIIPTINSSAIPIWENLNKHEKMTYLYRMFENQVGEFCEENNKLMNNCNNELLKYGLGRLKGMPEDHLDQMDPYERDAHDKIWDSMMAGHSMMEKSQSQNLRRPTTTTSTSKPNSYNDEQFGDFGAASARYENVVKVAPPTGFVWHLASGTPQYVQPPRRYNALPVAQAAKQGAYQRFQSWYSTPTPLDGPMVVRVHPDGRPVRENVPEMPRDDDLMHYQLVRSKLPNF